MASRPRYARRPNGDGSLCYDERLDLCRAAYGGLGGKRRYGRP